MIICRHCNSALTHPFPDRWWIGTARGQCGYCQQVKPDTISVLTPEESAEMAARGKDQRRGLV